MHSVTLSKTSEKLYAEFRIDDKIFRLSADNLTKNAVDPANIASFDPEKGRYSAVQFDRKPKTIESSKVRLRKFWESLVEGWNFDEENL